MVKKESLRVGLLVWWSANRLVHAWSCPGMITCVKEDSFKITSFNDFKESEDLHLPNRGGESILDEMRQCTLNEVKEYFKIRERVLNDVVTQKTRELADASEDLRSYKQGVAEFFSKRGEKQEE